MALLGLLIVPLAAGLLCWLAARRRTMEIANLAAAALIVAFAAFAAGEVLGQGPVSVWNGFLYADAFSALVVLLTGFVYLACSVYAVGYFREDERQTVSPGDATPLVTIHELRQYYSLTPVFVFSMLLVALANNLA